jgi:sugar transferase (PEP-CTERM/EpsH1 system associated)
MNILFITARFPYPPLKGDQVVPYHRLRLLSKKHKVTLITFYQSNKELECLDKLKPFCQDILTVKLGKLRSFSNMFGGIFSKLPFQVIYFSSIKFRRTLAGLLASKNFDIIHTYTLRLAEYTKDLNKKKILDLIDSMQLNYQKRVIIERWFLRGIFKNESERINIYEKEIIQKYDLSILVSEKDKEAINLEKVVAIPLGVETDVFKNKGELPNNKTIIFSGNMKYYPNEKAIIWFFRNCFGVLKQNIPDVKLIIAGSNPTREIKSLHDGISVFVTGFVESMAETLCRAQLAIAPMQSGYGMHIKMLEAMSCGLPVVCTSSALGAIRASNGKEVIVADNIEDFVDSCIRLLLDYKLAQRMGRDAQSLVSLKYSWETHAGMIDTMYRRVATT